MSVVRNDIVRVGADFSGFIKGTKQGEKAVASFNLSSNKVFSRLKSLGKAAMAAVSVTAVVAAANKCKEAYESQAEANAKLEHVMSHSMGARAEEIASVKELTDSLQNRGVISADIQAAGAQELATYVSMTGTLKKLIPVMNDMTAQQYGYNATAENAVGIATMLGKVMNGQTSALSRYGYSFTEAQAKVLKYGNEEERVAVLADVVSASVGGMNEALAQTPAGRLQQVKNRLDDIQASFGAAVTNIEVLFLPALNTVNNVLAGMANLANMVAQSFVNVFGGTAAAAGNAVTYTGAATSGVDDLTDSLNEAGGAAKKLGTASFDTLQKLSGASSGGSGGGGSAGGGASITTNVPNLGTTQFETPESLKRLEEFLERVKEKVNKFDLSKLDGSIERLKTALEKLSPDLWEKVEWGIENVLVPLAGWTLGELAPASIDTLAASMELLHTATKEFKPYGEWFWNKFLEPLSKWTGGRFVSILNTTSYTIRALNELLKRLGINSEETKDEIDKLSRGTGSFDDVLGKVKERVKILTDGLWGLAALVAENNPRLAMTLSQLALFPSTIMNIGSAIKKGLGDAASWLDNHVFNPIAKGFEDTVNGIIGGINKLIEGVNSKLKITLPKWNILGDLSGKSYGVNIPKLQPINIMGHIGSGKFATGGAITRPTVGLIGEAGPERVIPLSQDAKWLDALASRINGNGNNTQLISMLRTIIQYLRAPTPIKWNDRELGRMTREINRREAAISGVG